MSVEADDRSTNHRDRIARMMMVDAADADGMAVLVHDETASDW